MLQLNSSAHFVHILVLVILLFVLLRRTSLRNSISGVIVAEVGLLVPSAFFILHSLDPLAYCHRCAAVASERAGT